MALSARRRHRPMLSVAVPALPSPERHRVEHGHHAGTACGRADHRRARRPSPGTVGGERRRRAAGILRHSRKTQFFCKAPFASACFVRGARGVERPTRITVGARHRGSKWLWKVSSHSSNVPRELLPSLTVTYFFLRLFPWPRTSIIESLKSIIGVK